MAYTSADRPGYNFDLSTGAWHFPNCDAVSLVQQSASHGGATTANWVCFPLWVPPDQDWGVTQIGCMSAGSTGDAGATDLNVILGLYASNSSYYPTTLLHDTGIITINTTGIQTDGAFTEVTLSAGNLYYLMSHKQNLPSNNAAATASIVTAQRCDHMPYATTDSSSLAQGEHRQPIYWSSSGGTNAPSPWTAAQAPSVTVASWIVPYFYLNSVS